MLTSPRTPTLQIGRLENIVGWYHSHPGYGCWLSGIDVQTQMTNQTYSDPFLAVVVRPSLSLSLLYFPSSASATKRPNINSD